MTSIAKSLIERCSQGAVFHRLGDVADCVVGGTPSRGTSTFWEGGTIPWMKSGEVNKGIVVETENHITQLGLDSSNARMVPAGSVVLALAGQGKTRGLVARTRIELCTNQSLCAITPHDSLDSDFLYFFLTTQYQRLREVSSGDGSRGGLNLQAVRGYRIPVPPLDVQLEVVRVLEEFSEMDARLAAELDAELEARQRQYIHYRDSLLAFGAEEVRWQTIGEAGSLFGGLTGKSKSDFTDGNARYVTYMNVFNNLAVQLDTDDRVTIQQGERQRQLALGDIIFTGSSEAVEECGMSSVVVEEPNGPLYMNSFCIGFRLNDPSMLDPQFAKHLFRSAPLREQIVKAANGVTRFNVSKKRLAKTRFPVPDLTEQRRIATVLNELDALVRDLSAALPAEIAARRKQYEYYRDRLLTFEEASA